MGSVQSAAGLPSKTSITLTAATGPLTQALVYHGAQKSAVDVIYLDFSSVIPQTQCHYFEYIFFSFLEVGMTATNTVELPFGNVRLIFIIASLSWL